MEAGTKRKRDLGCPRITFHAPDRTFDRLLREDSLEELKDVVKKKLGLAPNVVVRLSQLRGDSTVDLEDEDDFDAFYNVLHSTSAASVRVSVSRAATAKNTQSSESGQLSRQKKQKLDAVPQLSLTTSNDPVNPAPPVPVPAPTSRKRAVVFAQSGAKPPKTASTVTDQPDSSTQVPIPTRAEPSKQADANSGTEERITQPSNGSSMPRASSVEPLQEKDDVGKTPNPKRRKTVAPRTLTGSEAVVRKQSTDKKASDSHEKQVAGRTKQMTVEGTPKPSNLGPTMAGPPNPPQPADVISQKVARSKKIKSSVKPSQTDTLTTEQPKKTSRSKSKARESTSSVDSERSNSISPAPNAQITSALSAISRRMIEKYIIPTSSTSDVNPTQPEDQSTKTAASAAQLDSREVALSVSEAQSKLTCPYCGKPLTHDRSHCPLIRAKNPELVERRISMLMQDTGEDVDEGRENTIEALRGALLRIRSAGLKKGTTSNVSSSKPVPYVDPISAGPNPKVATASSVTVPSTAPPQSPSSSNSSSDEDIPLRKLLQKSAPRTSHDLHTTSVPSQGMTALPLLNAQPAGALSASTDDSSEANTFSEDESSQDSETTSHAEESNSSSGSSSEDEFATRPQLQQQPLVLFPGDIPSYIDKDLEALIRGPDIPVHATELPSSESSSEDGESDDEQVVYESEEEPICLSQNARRSSVSSSDSRDMDEDSDSGDDALPNRDLMHLNVTLSVPDYGDEGDKGTEAEVEEDIPPESILGPSARTFRQLNGRQRSVEWDRAGNEAFEQAVREENAVFDLATRRSLSPVPKKTSSRLASKAHQVSLAHGINSVVREKEPDSVGAQPNVYNDPANGTSDIIMEDVAEPVQVAIPNSVESPEAFNHPQRTSIEAIGDDETPSTPPPPPQQPREERERASTPPPGLMQRMRSRIGLASPVRGQRSKPDVTPSLTLPPKAKPRLIKATSVRNQERPQTRSNDAGLGHEEDGIHNNSDTTPPVAPSESPAPDEGALSTTKPVSTRTRANTEKKVEKNDEQNQEEDPPLRRTTRAATKAATTNAKVSLPNGSQPTTRRTRLTKTADPPDDISEFSHPPAKKQAKESKNKKVEANPTVKSPTSLLTSKVTEADASEVQSKERRSPHTRSPPTSLHVWETIQPGTPPPTTQSDPVDELQSDVESIHFALKPQFQRKSAVLGRKHSRSRPEQAEYDSEERGNREGEEREEDPLFMSSDSQSFYPHSQFQTPMTGPLGRTHSRLEQAMCDSEARGRREQEGKEKGKDSLFTLNDSQIESPHPQFQTQGTEPADSDSSDSEAEVHAAVLKKPVSNRSQIPQYRKLSEYATRAPQLFTPKVLKQSTGRLQSAGKLPVKRLDRLNLMYGSMARKDDDDDRDDDESDGDSGHGSESETEKSSHIPKSRKAGVGLRRRMSLA